MREYLFATPWWLVTAIAVVAVMLLYTARKRQDKRLRYLGLGVLVLMHALIFASLLVETDLELCTRRSRQLVAAVDRKDWQSVEKVLDPSAVVKVGDQVVYSTRQRILQAGRSATYVQQVSPKSLEARQTGGVITVDLAVDSRQTISEWGEFTIGTRWELIWTEFADGWALSTITATAMAGQDPSAMIPHMPKE